jgi:HEAT repeat protein
MPMTTAEQWREFLQRWSDDWLATDEPFPAAVRRSRWLGFKPATEDQTDKLERRLGYRLPPSYRAFLLTTNGWRRTAWMVERVRPANKVEWLDVDDPQLLDAWEQGAAMYAGGQEDRGEFDGLTREEYFTYDERRQVFNHDHLRQSLKIADPVEGDSAIYVLNPLCVTEDGEWEAWMHAHWLPGAERYPSFAHLMCAEYEAFRTVREGVAANAAQPRETGPYTGVYAPDRPRHAAEKIYPGKRREPRLTIEQLVAKLEDPSPAARKKAAQTLLREFKPHDPGDERPHLVAPLARILGSRQAEPDVRAAAACMLGSYGTVAAIAPLVAAMKDPAVAAAALTPLLYLSIDRKDKRIADGLIAFLESQPHDPSSTDTAINILHHEFKDPRLAPLALRLIDDDTIHVHSRFGAAFALATVAPKQAANELLARLAHPSASIRQIAATAIRQTGDRRAIAPLRKLLKDPDPSVRQQAAMSLRFLEQ